MRPPASLAIIPFEFQIAIIGDDFMTCRVLKEMVSTRVPSFQTLSVIPAQHDYGDLDWLGGGCDREDPVRNIHSFKDVAYQPSSIVCEPLSRYDLSCFEQSIATKLGKLLRKDAIAQTI